MSMNKSSLLGEEWSEDLQPRPRGQLNWTSTNSVLDIWHSRIPPGNNYIKSRASEALNVLYKIPEMSKLWLQQLRKDIWQILALLWRCPMWHVWQNYRKVKHGQRIDIMIVCWISWHSYIVIHTMSYRLIYAFFGCTSIIPTLETALW